MAFIIFLSILFVLTLFVVIIIVDKGHEEELQEQIQAAEQPLIEQIEKMTFQMRSHSHDFHNHVEVLQGLLEVNKYEEAKEYMDTIHMSVSNSQFRVFPFQQPIVTALLQAKSTYAEQLGIQIDVISSEPLLFPHLRSYDMVRIIGNLLDNAIEALENDVQTHPKIIELHYEKKLNIHILTVGNTGPQLTSDQMDQMFLLNYTTKANHRGTGLASIKNIVEHYFGHVSVFNKEDKVIFKIAIPE